MATITAAISVALDHYQAGRFPETATLCRRILEQAPDEADARRLLGVALAGSGDVNGAIRMLRGAIALAPAVAGFHRNLAELLEATQAPNAALTARRALIRLEPGDRNGMVALLTSLAALADAALDRGDVNRAIPLYREARRLYPASLELCFNLAIAERDAGLMEAAVADFGAAARLRPDFARTHLELGLAEKRLGRLPSARRAMRRALCLAPADADGLYALGAVTDGNADPEPALRLLRRAARIRPEHDGAHAAAAIILQSTGRRADAIAGYRRAIVLRPAMPEALTNLCVALTEQGALFEAARLGERAVRLTPDSAAALLTLGGVFQATRAPDAAAAIFRMALDRRPDFAEAHGNLGAALSTSGRPAEAEQWLRRAIALRPDQRTQYANTGLVLKDMGRMDDAMAAYRRALTIDPDWAETHSDMIFAMDLLPGVATAELQAARRVFNQHHGAPLRSARKPLQNNRDPDRRLRIGHVTADFRVNSAAFAFGPILEEMDRTAFDVVCYSGVAAEDDLTRRFRAMATDWRSTVGVGDAALADRIRADGIDILVDMSGHSSGNRLRVFAHRPAPVQLSAWTHPHGIGLETMDYIFSDPVTIPYEERALFQETVWDLPLCIPFRTPTEAPPVEPLPAENSGRITFGCLNRLSKVTAPVVALWAQVLHACPTADLLLKDKALNDPAERRRLAGSFAGQGVAPDRLRFLGGSSRAEHLAANGRIDIALDPFPLNGGITTMESLWMGVPVVALLGAAPPSRVSAAIMTCLGLSDWVADSPEKYVAIAAAMARDPAALARLRCGMRARFVASPAGDISRYTRAVERAYREMWRRWLSQS